MVDITKGNADASERRIRVQITDKLTKPLTEVKYLNADNVSRYRCIMRIFFENYEKLHYWMYQEEVYAQMKEDLAVQEAVTLIAEAAVEVEKTEE